MPEIKHTPVLVKEVIDALQVERGGKYIDCTLGGGGHARAILESCGASCRLLGIDADPGALATAEVNLKPFQGSYILVEGNFKDLETIARQQDFLEVQGVLFDLGLSSLQLDKEDQRGFSFYSDKPLDMRFSPKQEVTAAMLVNSSTEEELIYLIRDYGEEEKPRKMARAIIAGRPFKTAKELAETIEKVKGKRGRIHPATKIFQALRIAVNRELDNLKQALKQVINVLAQGGRLVFIAYHSLEDRIVKEFIKRESMDCICPTPALVCACGHQATLEILTRRVIRPGSSEIESNPRSRSARMRVAERLQPEGLFQAERMER